MLLPGTTSSGFAMKRSSFSSSQTKSASFIALETRSPVAILLSVQQSCSGWGLADCRPLSQRGTFYRHC
jgi:hypothetical protein